MTWLGQLLACPVPTVPRPPSFLHGDLDLFPEPLGHVLQVSGAECQSPGDNGLLKLTLIEELCNLVSESWQNTGQKITKTSLMVASQHGGCHPCFLQVFVFIATLAPVSHAGS